MSIFGTGFGQWTLGFATLLAVTTAATNAHAYDEERTRHFQENYGNTRVFGEWTFDSHQENHNGLWGAGSPDASYRNSSDVSQELGTRVIIFGKHAKPFKASMDANAYWSEKWDRSSNVYGRSAHASATVLGDVVYSKTGTACGTGMRCIDESKNYEKEFVHETARFALWVVEIEVTGIIAGSTGAGLTAESKARRLGNEYGSLDAHADVSLAARAGLTAQFDTCVGWCGKVAVGIDTSIGILDLQLGPHARSEQVSHDQGNVTFSWINRASLDLITMDGSVKLKVDYLFGHDETTIVSWDGYEASWKLWGNSGSRTCVNWGSVCIDEIID
jgi:hypothetical protein